MRKLVPLLLIPFITSCFFNEGPAEFPAGEVIGYKPVYAESISEVISFSESRNLVNPGKIYTNGNWIFVNELYEGVHIIDNSNPVNPTIVGFITVAGNIDIAFKGDLLIADHLGDLVTIDISDIENPKEIDRVSGLYDFNTSLPPAEGRYFECADPERAHLIRQWVLVPLINPECYR